MNFLRRLALQENKKTWWQLMSRCCWNHTRPWHASELVSFLVGLKTYQHPLLLKMYSFIRLRTSELKNEITLVYLFHQMSYFSAYNLYSVYLRSRFQNPARRKKKFILVFCSFIFLVSPEEWSDEKSKKANSVSIHISLVSCTNSLRSFVAKSGYDSLKYSCTTEQCLKVRVH